MKLNKEKLEILIATNCFTNEMLAETSGISRPMISKYVSGKIEPRPIIVGKIAKALNCEVTDIIE